MKSSHKDRYSRKVRDVYNQNIMSSGISIPAGIYRGIVVDYGDPSPNSGIGKIKVHISSLFAPIVPSDLQGASASSAKASATPNSPIPTSTGDEYLGAIWCQRMTPFGGTYTDGEASLSTGIFGPPPDIGNEVIVAFTPDSDKGIILGVIPHNMKNMAGPTASNTSEGTYAPSYDVPKTRTSESELPPEHPQAAALRTQGLDKDIIRGPSRSSPLRDGAQRLVGLSTPKGHSITLDDGLEEEDLSNQIRIRTSGGAQILIDDNHGFIYIINQNGSAWMEMNRNGDFDIFSGGSVNIHTLGNFNVHADAGINLHGQGGVNAKTCGEFIMEASGGNIEIHSTNEIKISNDLNDRINLAGGLKMTSDRIDLNGPQAAVAKKPVTGNLVGNRNVTESITGRVPEREPWSGHLDYAVINPTSGDLEDQQTTYPGARIDPNATNNSYPAAPSTSPSGLVRFKDGANPKVDSKLLETIDEIAKEFGRPLTISEGFRTPQDHTRLKNQWLAGKGNKPADASMHLVGRAVDISGQGLSNADKNRIIAIARTKPGIGGIGRYRSGHIHLDNGPRREWNS